MKLYLEKRGCDFFESDERVRESDLGNYRLFMEFIDKEGKRVCGDVSCGQVREECWNKRKTQKKWVVVSQIGLYAHLQYENYKGTWVYPLPYNSDLRYTKADVLKLVNSVSAVKYDGVEILENLPDAAHEYPEHVLALECAYLDADHKAMVKHLKDIVRENFVKWTGKYFFQYCAPEEYKEITLLAFNKMVEKYGVAENPTKIQSYIHHFMTSHFFEEQPYIDPFEDKEFLGKLEKLSPCNVRQYILAHNN